MDCIFQNVQFISYDVKISCFNVWIHESTVIE